MSKKSKELGLQEIYIDMGTFDFAVYVMVGDYEAVCKYAAWKFESNDYEDFALNSNDGYIPRGKTLFRTGYVPLIWVPKKPETPREYATLSHECLHATMHLFSWASIPNSPDTEEVMCHAMSHLINKTLEKIR